MHPALSARPLVLLAGVSVMASLACDVTIRDGDIKDVSVHGRASQEWRRQYGLADGGRVEIVNASGSIDVAVGPPNRVEVVAVLEAQAMTEARAKEILDETTLEETATSDHIRIATARRRRGGGLDVRFTVTLPAGTRLEMTGNDGTLKAHGLTGHVRAMVVNGGVELTAMTGTIDAAAVNGSISVKMAEVSGPMRLESTNGRIALELPKSSKATLNVRSVNGGIAVTGLNTEEGEGGRRIRTLESALNGGGPEIDVRVTNGRISIAGVENPVPGSPASR